MKRFFLAHRYGIPDEFAYQMARQAEAAMARIKPGATVRVVLGLEDWHQNFRQAGSWREWLQRWAIGTNSLTGQYHYDGAIVPDFSGLGRYTGEGLQLMLQVGRPVFYFDGAWAFYQVRAVRIAGGSARWPKYQLETL